jgi:hypothetical protein
LRCLKKGERVVYKGREYIYREAYIYGDKAYISPIDRLTNSDELFDIVVSEKELDDKETK